MKNKSIVVVVDIPAINGGYLSAKFGFPIGLQQSLNLDHTEVHPMLGLGGNAFGVFPLVSNTEENRFGSALDILLIFNYIKSEGISEYRHFNVHFGMYHMCQACLM